MRPLVIAHRGASWDLPENTLPAFERAIELGADYVEFDVRAGPQKALVCAHGPLSAAAASECVTVDEVLETLRGRVGLAVDVKEARAVEPILDALERHRIADDELLVVSFRRTPLEAVRERRPKTRLVLHLGRRRDVAVAEGFWGVGLRDRQARRSAIARAAELGLAPTVFTVNEPERMRELAELGVHGIFSDRPDLLRQTLDARPA
ncbi:MAG TPA: glycerophosphodiester phosphodiesterase [Gaiellaceae bacterium]